MQILRIEYYQREFFKKDLTKEWNMFFTIISYSFSTKTGGSGTLTTLIQQIGVVVAQDSRINYDILIMQGIIEYLLIDLNHMVYLRISQVVLNRKFTVEHFTAFPTNNHVDPSKHPPRAIVHLKNAQNYEIIMELY